MRLFHGLSRSAVLPSLLAISLLVFFAGCPKPKPEDHQPTKLPLEGVKLRLVVVDDSGMAAAIRKTEGDWNSQTGATLEVTETTEAEFLKNPGDEADAAIGACYLLGPLAEREKLVEIPASLRAEGRKEWSGIFELPRIREAVWGSTTLGVPFGSPVLVCYYRADLLEQLGRRPPQTWDEYQELAKLLAERGKTPGGEASGKAEWCGVMEPLGPGWGGLVLLARASSGIRHPDNYSTWFNIRTMEPLIDSPAVVRALTQLVDTAKHGSAKQLEADPATVRDVFWSGQCGMALTWPTATMRPLPQLTLTGPLSAGVVALPGSREHYNINDRRWEKRTPDESVGVPLVGISGRMGFVLANAKKPQAAADLLLWLSASGSNPPPSARSPWTTFYRSSQLGSPGDWVEAPMNSATAAAYAQATEATLDGQQWTLALRIPGRRDYLAALDEAVAAAVRDEKSPAAALYEASQKWREITERLGLESQQKAYLRSLELD